MNVETFLETFDLFADAPDAFTKIRELVLALGVQGRLVPCSPRQTWGVLELGDIVATGLPSINPADSPDQLFELWSVPSYAGGEPEIVPGREIRSSKRHLPDSSILLGKINPHLNRVWRVSRRTPHPLIASPEWITIIPGDRWDAGYIARLLASPGFNAELCSTAQGMGSLTRASTKKLASIEIRRPPLDDQKRIVAKVDELMALCNRLEAQQRDRETRHAALARAALTRFAEAPTPANLGLLFHSSYTIPPADLRKAILTLAFQGKLAARSSSDEPCVERQKTTRTSEGKVPKWARPIEEGEKPFPLPSSWKWTRLGDIAALKHGYAFSSKYFSSKPAPFVLTTPGNFFENGGFRDRESKRRYYSGPVDPEFILNPGDLIIPMTEQAAGLLGSPAFIPDDGRVYVHNQRLGKLSFSKSFSPEFAFWFFNTEYFRGVLAKTCTGMKVRHTSPDRVLKALFPVCPLAEQRRIVAKVDQLMTLVDRLEAQLAASRAAAKDLLDAAVAELTAS